MFELGKFLLLLMKMRWRSLAGAILGLLTLVAGVSLLALSGWFISAAAFAGLSIATATSFNYFLPSVGVRFFALLRIAARYGERVVNHDTTFLFLTQIRVWCFDWITPVAPNFVAHERRTDFLNRMVTDVNTLDGLYIRVLLPWVLALVVALLLWLFLHGYVAPVANAILLLMLVAIVVLPLWALYWGKKRSIQLITVTRALHVQLIETIQRMAELLMFSGVARQRCAFACHADQLIAAQLKMAWIKGALQAGVVLFSGLSVSVELYFGVTMVHAGQLNGAMLALVALAVLGAYEAVQVLPVAFQYLGQMLSATQRLSEIKHHAVEILYPEQTAQQPQDFSITFEQIDFAYHMQTPVLQNFNLTLRSG